MGRFPSKLISKHSFQLIQRNSPRLTAKERFTSRPLLEKTSRRFRGPSENIKMPGVCSKPAGPCGLTKELGSMTESLSVPWMSLALHLSLFRHLAIAMTFRLGSKWNIPTISAGDIPMKYSYHIHRLYINTSIHCTSANRIYWKENWRLPENVRSGCKAFS